MTDEADTTDPGSELAGEPTPAQLLLALQEIDSQADLLGNRRERLAEREALAAQTALMRAWERRCRELQERLAALDEQIEAAEAEGASLTSDRDRLQAQLKTVIAPREAEALMHEIATLDERREALDDRELAALDEQVEIDEQLRAHVGEEEARRIALGQADEALAAACADIDVEIARLDARRAEASAPIDEALLARYAKVRAGLGVAVARLRGHRCDGCHLDLSAAEIDVVKDEAAETGFTDCPQCGRMLVP